MRFKVLKKNECKIMSSCLLDLDELFIKFVTHVTPKVKVLEQLNN